MSRSMCARRGRSRMRPGLENLEGRTLLNASIDIGADGALVYRLGPDIREDVHVRRLGDVYTLQASTTIDVTSNEAGLAVTGSGTFAVIVSGPSSLRIVSDAEEQAVVVRSTGVATAIDLRASRSVVFLGDDGTEGSGGLAALAGPISVVAAEGTNLNGLRVSDGDFAYDPSGVLTYAVSATTVTAEGIDGFAGITYEGMASLTLHGTRSRSAPSALYLVTGTADGAATTIDATGGFGRDFSIVGTSTDVSSRLTLLSAGEAKVWASYIGSPTVFAGGSRSSISIEAVRDANRGLNSSLIVDAAAGGVEVNIGPYWSAGVVGGDVARSLVRGRDGQTAAPGLFARLADADVSAALYYRPDQLHRLGIDDRGAARSMLDVDFSDGDPIPSESPGWGRGLIYVASAGGPPAGDHSLGLAGSPPGPGTIGVEYHVALPLYRGAIELTKNNGTQSYISYQLAEGAARVDDAIAAAAYRWTSDLSGIPRGIAVDSEVLLTPYQAWRHHRDNPGDGWLLERYIHLAETTPGLRMASTTIARKFSVTLLRGWTPTNTKTTLDYSSHDVAAPAVSPSGLGWLSIENATPGAESSQGVYLVNGLPGVAISVRQGYVDGARVSLAGVLTSRSVVLSAGSDARLVVDAAGVPLSASDVVSLGEGWRWIPPTSTSAAVAFKDYLEILLLNTTEGDVWLRGD